MGHIKSISINEFNGSLNQKISFLSGLNIFSGVNGTGKTTVLKRLKERINDHQVIEVENTINGILAFSPKRNAEKKGIEAIYQYMQQQNRSKKAVLAEALGKAVIDHEFTKYESLGDVFVLDFGERSRTGNETPQNVMKQVQDEYNEVIKSVFPEYKLVSSWNPEAGTNGSPTVQLITKYGNPIDLSLMSCGESEVLALIFNVYFNRTNTDVYLIDEPEVHLNWSLEKGLFKFFDNFANDHKKQIIVTTHSRIIFDKEFSTKTQYFVFNNGKVTVDPAPPKEYLEEIAGETASIIATTAPIEKTFFVEDEFHKACIQKLLSINNQTGSIVIVKDSSGAIQNFFKVLKSNSSTYKKWINAYLLIDGDGKDQMYKDESRFIHLERYSIESYFFKTEVIAKVFGETESDLRKKIVDLIKNNPKFLTGSHSSFIAKLIDKLEPSDIDINLMSTFDTSGLLKKLLKDKKMKEVDFIDKYISEVSSSNEIEAIFDKKLIEAIKA